MLLYLITCRNGDACLFESLFTKHTTIAASAGAALIVRPAWGAAVAGIAAGNVARLSSPGSFTWTSPDRNISVFTGITAMAITVLLLGFRCVQLFAPALTEAHALHRTWSARRATNPGQS